MHAVITAAGQFIDTGKLRQILAVGLIGGFFLLFIPVLFFSFEAKTQNVGLSQDVLQYSAMVSEYCEQHGIPDFLDVALAVMMQESGGRVKDVMQASECEYNTKYPRKPNSIPDPEYSIDVGVQYLAECLRVAACTSPNDQNTLSLALQGFNYGKGYITWANKNYGSYSEKNAQEFAQKEAQRLGWKSYGDPQYVPHVMRYLSVGAATGDQLGNGALKYPVSHVKINSPYGDRKSGFHGGVDFAASTGTQVYACADGTVVSTYQWQGGYTGTASWGTHVIVKHSETVYTLYAHNSSLQVTKGMTVKQGDVIALSGNTGRSSGPHVHLELWIGGYGTQYRVNPVPYLQNEKQLS